jgi:hypothetical protein
VVSVIFRIALGSWLTMQAIGIIFYCLYHFTNPVFSDFMFSRYIQYWDKWGNYIMTELTPSWLWWIWILPTWQDPIGWLIIAGSVYLFMQRFKKKPTLFEQQGRK